MLLRENEVVTREPEQLSSKSNLQSLLPVCCAGRWSGFSPGRTQRTEPGRFLVRTGLLVLAVLLPAWPAFGEEAPAIHMVQRSDCELSRGVDVQVFGSGFTRGDLVTVSGKPVKSSVDSPEALHFRIPPADALRPGLGWVEVWHKSGARSEPYPITRGWTRIPSIPKTPVRALAVGFSPSGAPKAVATAGLGVFLSLDGGDTFTQVGTAREFEGSQVERLAVPPSKSGLIVARTRGDRFLWSDSEGARWQEMPVPDLKLRGDYVGPLVVDQRGRAYAGTAEGILELDLARRRGFFSDQPRGPFSSATVDTSGTAWFATERAMLFKKPLDGKEWSQVQPPGDAPHVQTVLSTPFRHGVFVIASNKLYSTVDGKEWTLLLSRAHEPFLPEPGSDSTYVSRSGSVRIREGKSDKDGPQLGCDAPRYSVAFAVLERPKQRVIVAAEEGLFALDLPELPPLKKQ
jgi:hypothetical protein